MKKAWNNSINKVLLPRIPSRTTKGPPSLGSDKIRPKPNHKLHKKLHNIPTCQKHSFLMHKVSQYFEKKDISGND